ncbi:hirip3 [Pungitius sinensis]
MASKKEAKTIRKFVCEELRGEPDLSKLTLGILKRRYLAHVRCEKLTPEARNIMKRVVEEEVMKMQDNDENESEVETNTKPPNKRKREKESAEMRGSGEEEDEEDESTAKKSRRQSNSSPESVEKDDCKTGRSDSEEEEQTKSVSEDEEQGIKKKTQKTNANIKRQRSTEDSTDEDLNRSKDGKSDVEEDPKEMVNKKTNATQNGEKRSSNSSPGKKTPQSAEEKETDMDSESEKGDNIHDNDPSDHSGKEEEISVETKNNDVDSDSSSLPSLEDEQQSGKGKTQDDKKKRTSKKGQKEKTQKDDNKAVVRLKRYISLCGVRLNYKKLLDGCRSVRSQVDVLKKELEGLGVDGQPSIVKCKKVRMKREESQELAELDVNNIIATKGRPKRRGSSAWQEKPSPPSSTYLRSLNSGSDSDEENKTHTARRRATDWANLQGIISDDADSN